MSALTQVGKYKAEQMEVLAVLYEYLGILGATSAETRRSTETSNLERGTMYCTMIGLSPKASCPV